MTPRREFGLTVLACAAGAGLVLYAASKGWERTVEARVAPLPPRTGTRSGGAIYPSLPTVALVALAGAGALLATRGTARRVIGVLVLACGVVSVATGAHALLGGRPGGWSVLCGLGGFLIAGAGLTAVWRGRRWPGMGARYERPASGGALRPAGTGSGAPSASAGPAPRGADQGARSAGDHAALWDALDRGEDRTRDP